MKTLDEKQEVVLDDPVNHPSHYTSGKIEVIDFIEDQKMPYHLGNACKYLCRAGKKDRPSAQILPWERQGCRFRNIVQIQFVPIQAHSISLFQPAVFLCSQIFNDELRHVIPHEKQFRIIPDNFTVCLDPFDFMFSCFFVPFKIIFLKVQDIIT